MELDAVRPRELTDAELDSVAGGEDRQEAQILGVITAAVNDVLNNIGAALQKVGRLL
jgi:hypothetical protein